MDVEPERQQPKERTMKRISPQWEMRCVRTERHQTVRCSGLPTGSSPANGLCFSEVHPQIANAIMGKHGHACPPVSNEITGSWQGRNEVFIRDNNGGNW